MKLSRRNFIKNSAIQMAGVASIPMILSATLPTKPATYSREKKQSDSNLFKEKGVVLFQGDSITDAGRNRKEQKPNDAGSFGNGYALMTAATLLAEMPEKDLTIYNRGISGNKVYQLAERWQEDCLDLKPDLLSILIGVNDYWHKRTGNYDGTVEVYEKDYRTLLKQTKETLPDITLIICEPFAIDGGIAIGEGWQIEFEPYRKVVKSLANEFNALFVPYHTVFNEALKYAPTSYWSPDGIHPSMAGAQLMAKAWLEVVR